MAHPQRTFLLIIKIIYFMKKIFTLVAMATLALGANAQTIVGGTFTVDNLPTSAVLDMTDPEHPTGGGYSSEEPFSLGTSDYVSVATGTPDDIQKTDSKKGTTSIGYYQTGTTYNDTKYAVIKTESGDKVIIDCTKGLSGSDNARYEDKSTNVSAVIAETKAPSHGVTIGFNTPASAKWTYGVIYLVAKIAGNKQYIVFEDGTPIPYTIVYDGNKDNSKNVVITPDMLGYNENDGKWNDDATLPKPDEKCSLAATGKNGTGVIFFEVTPNKKYLAMAIGSKISASGYAMVVDDYAKSVEITRNVAEQASSFSGNFVTGNQQSVWCIKDYEPVEGSGYGEASGDEVTAVAGVAEAKVEVAAPAKVVKNGQIFIGNYTVAGAQVK